MSEARAGGGASDDGFLDVYPALAVTCGPVTLRVPRLADVVQMARITHRGLFPDGPSTLDPWYDPQNPVANARSVLAYQFQYWGNLPNPPLRMPFAVVAGGIVVGTQGLDDPTGDFMVTREMSTGSWLDPAHRGRGVGTQARWAALAVGFEVLGAQTMVTRARLDGNPASNAVSRKCGYLDDGLDVVERGGERLVLRRWRMTLEGWRAADRPPVDIVGHESLAALFA